MTRHLYQYRQNGANGTGAAAEATAGTPAMSPLAADCIWLEGDLIPYEMATVHILNPTLHYGPGVFEGIRCYKTERGPAVFRLEDHLRRFLQSVHMLGVGELRWTLRDLHRAVNATILANNFRSCYVQLILYFSGGMGLDMDDYEPQVAVAAWELPASQSTAEREGGVRAMVSSFAHVHRNAGLTSGRINGQYVNSVLAKSVARRAGFDEAILLDAEGYVAECTVENLFIVRDGVIHAPDRMGAQKEIMRDTVATLAHDLGYLVAEERLSRDQLYVADEVFVCSTSAEIIPVNEIDFRPIGGGKRGPITAALQSLYANTVRGQGRRSPGWLEYVMLEPLY